MSIRRGLLITIVLTLVSNAGYGGLKIGGKKAETAQLQLEQEVDAMIAQGQSILQVQDSFDHAIALLKEAYFQANTGNYTEGIIQSANLLADGYLLLNDYANATTKYFTAMRHAETVSDSVSIAKAYRGLGLVKFNMKQWAESISNFNQARDFGSKSQQGSLNALIDYLLGLSYYHLGQYEVAEQSLLKAREVAVEQRDSMRLLEIDLNLTNVEVERTNSPVVQATYDRLYDAFEDRRENIGMCYALLGKTKSYLKSGDYENAQIHVNRALDMTKNSSINYPLQELLDVAVNAEYLSGNYKTAADLMLQLQALKESTLSESTATEVAMLSADYAFEKKEEQYNDEIKEKNKQRILLIVLVIAFFIISIVIFLSLRGVAKERHRSDKLLYNILPVETAKELKANGVAVAKAHNQVTIAFADVQNFTKIASHLEPTVLVQLLDYYFVKFDEIMQQYGLEKIKTIGDAYMFVSGLNDNNSNNAVKAVSAGLDMLQVVKAAQEEVQTKFGAQFNFRIGMHTGKTVSGVVGRIKYAFDIWGDSVNIAARMEAHSEPGKINISEDTYGLVKGLFACSARGHIDVKNKGSMQMYFVETKKPAQN